MDLVDLGAYGLRLGLHLTDAGRNPLDPVAKLLNRRSNRLEHLICCAHGGEAVSNVLIAALSRLNSAFHIRLHGRHDLRDLL